MGVCSLLPLYVLCPIYVQFAIVGFHIYFQKLYERSWGGFSIDAFLPQPLYALVMAAIPVWSAAGYLAALSQVLDVCV